MFGKKVDKRKRNIIIRIIFRIILIIAALMLLLSYSAVYVNPLKQIIPLFFGLYYIPILFLNIFLLIIAIIGRSKSAWIPIVILLPSLLYAERFINLFSSNEFEEGKPTITLLSYNVASFKQIDIVKGEKSNKKKRETIATIIDSIKAIDPDIICLQEFVVRVNVNIDSIFNGFKYIAKNITTTKKLHKGNIIISKYPIVKKANLKFKQSTNRSMYADIKVGNDTIRIFNNHLESYSISFKTLATRLKNKDTTSELAKEEIYNVHKKIGKTVQRRTRQVENLIGIINESPYPTIICGDFNETPMSFAYSEFSKGHKDSFMEGGKGFGATFRILYPLIRIDYIFVPKEYNILSHNTLKWKISDHYPILSNMQYSSQFHEKK